MLKENFSHVYDKFKLLLYDKAFNDDGDDDALSAFEVICMEIITALKEPTVNAFADAAHMSSPNATYRVNSLIKKGYINKKRGETDRREYYLEATEKYTKNYGMVYDYIGIVCDRIKEKFSEEDVEKLDEILEVVAKELTSEADSFHSVAIRKRKLKGVKA